MPTLNSDRWHEVSPYLDQALALPDAERAAWLASLGAENPDLVAFVGALLDEHRVLA